MTAATHMPAIIDAYAGEDIGRAIERVQAGVEALGGQVLYLRHNDKYVRVSEATTPGTALKQWKEQIPEPPIGSVIRSRSGGAWYRRENDGLWITFGDEDRYHWAYVITVYDGMVLVDGPSVREVSGEPVEVSG